MKLVVDTNLVFSAILNTNSQIAHLLSKPSPYNFIAPAFLIKELDNHQSKLIELLGNISKEELNELIRFVTKNIRFISEYQIKPKHWIKAEQLTQHVDADDIAFVALALQFDAILWTGDKKLQKGLVSNQFEKVVTTQELLNSKNL